MKAIALALLAGCAAAAAQPAEYAIDPTHTFVNFEIAHFGLSTTRGRWDRKDGSVSFDRAARRGRVEVTIEMASVSTGVAVLDNRLRAADFFDVAAHPQARFVGERFAFEGDRVTEVSGELTLRGRTLPLTLKAVRFGCYQNPIFRREVCGGDFEALLRRSEFGIVEALPTIAADEVKLLIQVEAIRQ